MKFSRAQLKSFKLGGEKIQGFIFKYIVEVALFTHKKDRKLWLDVSLIFQTTVPSAESGNKFLSWFSDLDD